MAKHLKIKTGIDNKTHFDGCIDDHTLCGLDINGDPTLSIGIPKEVKVKVDCRHCIMIAEYCHSIKRSEWK